MEMRHDSQEPRLLNRLAIRTKLTECRVVQCLVMCADTNNAFIAYMLVVFAIPTYRSLADSIPQFFVGFVITKELFNLVLHSLHNTYSHKCFCFVVQCCRGWDRTSDLQVMSLASYLCSTLRCCYINE